MALHCYFIDYSCMHVTNLWPFSSCFGIAFEFHHLSYSLVSSFVAKIQYFIRDTRLYFLSWVSAIVHSTSLMLNSRESPLLSSQAGWGRQTFCRLRYQGILRLQDPSASQSQSECMFLRTTLYFQHHFEGCHHNFKIDADVFAREYPCFRLTDAAEPE